MKIAIIGFSRFGQLWAKLMKPFGEVLVFSREDRRQQALELGVTYYSFDQLAELSQADWVFLAVSISATESVIKNIAQLVRPGALMMDVCSVKYWPCKWLSENLNSEIEIMGTHPMFGPDSIKTGLAGKQIILCPLRISSDSLAKVKAVFEAMELQIIETTPEDHDRQNAYSLALVHFIGRALDKMELEKIKIATLGFERLRAVSETVSNDSWQLFEDMEKCNPYAAEVRAKFTGSLAEIEAKLKSDQVAGQEAGQEG